MFDIDLKKLFNNTRDESIEKKGKIISNRFTGRLSIYSVDHCKTSNKSTFLRCILLDSKGNYCHGSIFYNKNDKDDPNNGIIDLITDGGVDVECNLSVSLMTKKDTDITTNIFWTVRNITILGDVDIDIPIIKDITYNNITEPRSLSENNDINTINNNTNVDIDRLDNMDIKYYLTTLGEYINCIQDYTIKEFVKYAFKRIGYSEDVSFNTTDRISLTCGSGKSGHHNYRWGLVEHLVNVTKKALCNSEGYTGINKDLVIAGALLHDYGKFMCYNEAKVGYNVDAHILGHLVLGVSELQKVACELQSITTTKVDANKLDRLVMYLSGICTSHHGLEQYGSIHKPFCLEALIIFQADMGDVLEFTYKELSKNNTDDVVQVLDSKYINRDLLDVYFNVF